MDSLRINRLCVDKADFNLTGGWCPEAKTDASVPKALGTERHVMTALHSTLPSCRCGAPSKPPWNALAGDTIHRGNRAYPRGASHLLETCPSTRPSASPDEAGAT